MLLLLTLACGAKEPPEPPELASSQIGDGLGSGGGGLGGGLGEVALEGDRTGLATDSSGPPREGLPPLPIDPPLVDGVVPEVSLEKLHVMTASVLARCSAAALGRDPHLRGTATLTATYDAEGKATLVSASGDGDALLHSCMQKAGERVFVRDLEAPVTFTWTLPVDPRHVAPGAVLRGNGYAMGYTGPSPELPALLLALGFPTPIDGAPEHAALAAALAAAHHDCGGLLPPMAPRPLGVLSLTVSEGALSEVRVLSSDAKGEALLSCVEAAYLGLAVPGEDGRYSYVVGY